MNATELLAEWAAKHQIESVLERIGGDASPMCAELRRRGARVSAIVDDERAVHRARVAYDDGDVRLATAQGEAAKHDLVVVHGEVIDDAELAELATHATKLLVIVAPNPRAIAARAGHRPSWGATESLAPLLWSLGRVREHVFTDFAPFVVPLLASVPRLERTLARSHVFLVDVAPRSRKARRKLRLNAQ